MTEIETRLAAINARAAAYLDKQIHRAKAINAAVTLILCLATVGAFFAAGSAADDHYRKEALANQEIVSWTK